MPKSIKLKNNTYIDSRGVVYNRKTLYDLLQPTYSYGALNTSAVNQGTCRYFTVGKIAIITITDLYPTTELTTHDTVLITGLPTPKDGLVFKLICQDGTSARVGVRTNGELHLHYSAMKKGSGSTQYYGQLVYITT